MPVPVRLEMLAGAPGKDFLVLTKRLSGVALLMPEGRTWTGVEGWVGTAVAAGQRFGVMDLLIAAIAREHDARLWSLDADFERMARLGFVELYAGP